MIAVQTENIHHIFPSANGKKERRLVLSDINLQINQGEIFGLLGPNGGGKTTLFRILTTLLKPSGGSATIFGADVNKDQKKVRQKFGIIFQHPSLDKKLSVLENLVHQGHLYGLAGEKLEVRINELLLQFDLKDRKNDLVQTLSGGFQRRAEIAKGLLHNPSLLIMDEPSTGLDPSVRRELWKHIQFLKGKNITVLFTTHLMEEAENCDRVAILNQGRMVALGTPNDLKNKIGGDIITIQSSKPADLVEMINNQFSCKATLLENLIRIEIKEGHTLIPKLAEGFPSLIDSITLGKPTLEDVFVHITGKTFI